MGDIRVGTDFVPLGKSNRPRTRTHRQMPCKKEVVEVEWEADPADRADQEVDQEEDVTGEMETSQRNRSQNIWWQHWRTIHSLKMQLIGSLKR